MKFRSLLACVVFALAGINSHGQDRHGLSLPQLWKQALANYPSLEAYRSQLRQADIDRRLTHNQYLPDMYLQAQTSVGTQNPISGSSFPLPGVYNVNGSESGHHPGTNIFGSVMMDWKFFQFGKQKKSHEAATIFSSQAMHRLDVEQISIQAEVSRRYFEFFYHRGMEAWARENADRLQTILQAAASRATAGLSPAADSLLIKATLNETRADLHLWEGRRAESKIALARWLNMSSDQLIVKDASFVNDGNREGIPRSLRENQIRHPLLAFKDQQVAYVEKQKEIASVSALPSLSLLAGAQLRGNSLNGENSFSEKWQDRDNNPVQNYAIGIGLTWNLGTAFDSRLEKRRYQEMLRQREAETEEAALGLQSLSEISQGQISQSRRQIHEAEEAYQSASQAYALFEARYNSGLISITELLQIQDVLQRTEKTRIEAYYQYWLHHVNLAESTADFSHLQSVFE
ncbi:MAG TPA: TolC family protein [Chryseosolibacter sp.]|nr:TolC family protein [Chryseosolibacter sp.]